MSGLHDASPAQIKAMYELLPYLDGGDLEWLHEWMHWAPEKRPNYVPCEPQIVVEWMMKMRVMKLK